MDRAELGKQFLNQFQSTLFSSKLDDGTATEKADILRRTLMELKVANNVNLVSDESCGLLLKKYEDSYAAIVDSMEENNGLNNYAEGALAICSRFKNESHNWKSSLSMDKIKQMECYKNITAKNKKISDELVPPQMVNKILSSESKKDPIQGTSNPTFVTEFSKTDQQNSNRGAQFSQKIDSQRESSNTGQKNGWNFHNRKPLFSGVQQSSSSDVIQQNSARPSYSGSYQRKNENFSSGIKRPLNNEDQEEEENTRNNPVAGGFNVFKTAKEQLAIDNQKKFGRGKGSVGSSLYGNAKKSLGSTRRGLNSKFIPPVANREEEEDSVTMNAVTKSVFGGGKPSGSNNTEEPTDERLKGIEPKMIELVMNEIMDHGPQMVWDDVAGLEFAKKTIKEIVVWPMLRPDIFTGLRGPPKGLLLFGPPGTGKTLIGKCIASQSKSTFFSISASSLTSKWVGEGEKMVRALFAVARVHQPAVVFIDEIDSLLSQRSDGEHEASRRIKTEFLVQLDGAATLSEDRILVIGATNRPQEIDEAARRRFVKRLYIPLPESAARKQIVVNLLSQQKYHLSDQELDFICQKTDGYSGADMANLCREAALGPIRSMAFGEIESISADQVRPITFEDFEDALPQVRASVSNKDLDLYIEWNNSYGSAGSVR